MQFTRPTGSNGTRKGLKPQQDYSASSEALYTPGVGKDCNLRSALSYVQQGMQVFPVFEVDEHGTCSCWNGPYCPHPGKHPRYERGSLEHGRNSSTTNEGQIRAWWTKWPHANIGIATGPESGLFVIDVDPRHGGVESLRRLVNEHGELGPQRVVRSGGGGLHLYFQRPGFKVKSVDNVLGEDFPGIDCKCDGGFILAPGSNHVSGGYRLIRDGNPGPAPNWLLDLLRAETEQADHIKDAVDGRSQTKEVVKETFEVTTIPDRARNTTLTRVAGKLRSQGLDEPQIFCELQSLNNARCSPKLVEAEVEKIARSVCRYAPGKARKEPTPEVLELCRTIEERVLWGRRWPGLGGKSQRALVLTVLQHAILCGELLPCGGIRVSLSHRAAAEDAVISRKAIHNALRHLKPEGILRTDPPNKRGESGAFVLMPPPQEASAQGVTTRITLLSLKRKVVDSGNPLRAPYSAARLRHAAPGIWRLGKGCEEFVDALEMLGGSASVQEIAALLHHPRPRDLRRPGRVGRRLEEEGVVEWTGDTVSFTRTWREVWHRARLLGKELEAAERDRARHVRERESFLNRAGVVAEKAPTHEEMRQRRESFAERRLRATKEAVARLFAQRPEYRTRRSGQVRCGLVMFDVLLDGFPYGNVGPPTDQEVELVVSEDGVAA